MAEEMVGAAGTEAKQVDVIEGAGEGAAKEAGKENGEAGGGEVDIDVLLSGLEKGKAGSDESYDWVEKYGGREALEEAVRWREALFSNWRDEEKGTELVTAIPFLQYLYDNDRERYAQLVNDVIRSHPDVAIDLLKKEGKIGEREIEAAATEELELARVPEHLREVYKRLPSAVREEMRNLSDAALVFNLETLKKAQDTEAMVQEAQRKQLEERYYQAQKKGEEAVLERFNQQREVLMNELRKWKLPIVDEGSGETLRGIILSGAFDKILSDEEAQRIYNDAIKAIQEVPVLELEGRHRQAREAERAASQGIAQLTVRVAREVKNIVKELDGIFRDALAYRESHRNERNERREIAGAGAITSSGGKREGQVTPLLPDGRIDPRYYEMLAEEMRLRSQ